MSAMKKLRNLLKRHHQSQPVSPPASHEVIALPFAFKGNVRLGDLEPIRDHIQFYLEREVTNGSFRAEAPTQYDLLRGYLTCTEKERNDYLLTSYTVPLGNWTDGAGWSYAVQLVQYTHRLSTDNKVKHIVLRFDEELMRTSPNCAITNVPTELSNQVLSKLAFMTRFTFIASLPTLSRKLVYLLQPPRDMVTLKEFVLTLQEDVIKGCFDEPNQPKS